MNPALVLAFLQALLPVLEPVIAAGAQALIDSLKSGQPLTPAQQAQLDAAQKAAHARVQGLSTVTLH